MAAGWYERAEVVRRPIRAAWPRILIKGGRRVDSDFYRHDAMIVVAHADDETLGCGATIARKIASGAGVWVVVATDGSRSPEHVVDTTALVAQRRAELFRATARLKVPADRVLTLDLPDGALDSAAAELSNRVTDLLLAHPPSHLLTHSRWDPHPDHHACWQAVMHAARSASTHRPEQVAEVYEIPIWDWSLGPWPIREGSTASKALRLFLDPLASLLQGRAVLSPTADLLALKRAALTEYRSQIEPWSARPPSLPADFIDRFCGSYEVFLPGRPRQQRRLAMRREGS